MHCALPFCSTSVNVVALCEVLEAYDSPFRTAVHSALIEEGFDLGGRLPNLQLAGEIRDAIGGSLGSQGFDLAWESLRLFLEWAGHQGVLLDLCPDLDPWPATA